MSLGRVLVLGGAAGKKHPNAASVWGIVVSRMGGRCTHGLVWISLAFGIGSHQFCHLTSGASHVNRSVKAPIYWKSYECKNIKVHEVFRYSGNNSCLSGLGGQSEMKMRDVELDLCRLDKRTNNCAVMLLRA